MVVASRQENEMIIKVDPDFSGWLSIIKKGEVVFEKAYGFADIANQRPNTIHTRFATASAGKTFVAVAILKLIQQDKLALSDTIGKMLAIDWKQIDPDITIEQLLKHTSGIPDYFNENEMDDYEALWKDFPNYKIRTSSDLIPLFIDKPMMYPKNERFQYNNTGYVVLGLILEAIMDKPLDHVLSEIIFEPCNMHDTGYFELDRLPVDCANHYIWDKENNQYRTNIYSVDAKGSGAGGAFTSLKDIGLFWNHLLQGKIISMHMVKQMLSIQVFDQGDDPYGYGVWLRKCDDRLCPYMTGMDPGVSFISLMDQHHDVMITIASNLGQDVWSLMSKVIQAIKQVEMIG